MLSAPDLADLIAYAQARGAKIILAGDIHQLQAVENGGGMSLLAGTLGYVRLARPARFRAAWEQQASLRLRDGDTAVLAEYDRQGRVIGGEPEQMMDAAAAAYVALSRGTDVNLAYVFTTFPKRADPAPGLRPAAELARYDQISSERTGVRASDTRPAPPGTALAVLTGVLDRDGQQRSATQARNQALADADHLAILHAIGTAEATPARDQRYRDLLMSILPPADRREPSHRARWLWRTLRAAELAGQDAGQVLAAAVGERDLAGARDLAAVLDARLRYRLGALIPRPSGPWSAQLPEIADPERRAYVTEIAALMDARKDRIGEHVATTLSWLGDTAAEGIARQVLAAIEAPGLRPRPRRAALARLDLALALTAADKHDEAAGVALEAVTSGRLAPVGGRRAHEIVLAVAERGVPEAAELAEAYRETCDEPGRPALP